MSANRREFFGTLVSSAFKLAVGGLASVGCLWAAATARFFVPNVTAEPPQTFKAGLPNQYREGQVEIRFRDTFGVWIVCAQHQDKRLIYALRTSCTHLGCITLWSESEQRFRCPCHGSVFTSEGINVAGPAPRPLERCAIRVAEDGQLEIDRSRTFQKTLYSRTFGPWLVIISPAYRTPRNGRRARFMAWTVGTSTCSSTQRMASSSSSGAGQ